MFVKEIITQLKEIKSNIRSCFAINRIDIYPLINRVMKIIFCSIVILLLLSCQSETFSDNSPGLIEVAISEVSFESDEMLGNRAATQVENKIQRNTIELGHDLLMVAELQPIESNQVIQDRSRGALDTAGLADNVRYRLLVYTQAGAFVAERDYIRGQEANTEALQLDGGTTYTFVAVSLNNTDNMPPTTPAVATRTLANSQIAVNTGVTALMYYRQNLPVSGNAINRLDIIFKHQKPRIDVTINSTQTGYNITAATGRFVPHNNGMTVNLVDGTHTQSGTNIAVQVDFNTVGSQIVTSTSGNFINAINNNVTAFTLNSITIGSITATNLTPFTNLNVSAGVRYNLILNIVPTDGYLTQQGIPAARINGRIWARHNLGVNTTVDANAANLTVAQHGNYYQFGRAAIVAGPNSTAANANWSSASPPSNSWNAGTEAVPIKTATDPCPTGFRVPTNTEHQHLINATVATNRGPFTAGNTNYNSGKVLTSRRNSNVTLVLPAQGFLDVFSSNPPTPGPVTNRGSNGAYTSSTASGTNGWRLVFASTTISSGEWTGDQYSFQYGRPIRCIGI